MGRKSLTVSRIGTGVAAGVKDNLGLRPMKRRLCSYDMFEVPDAAYVLSDGGGEMYFCNARCLCVWTVQLATHSALTEEQKNGELTLLSPSRDQSYFKSIADVALWAVENALGSERS